MLVVEQAKALTLKLNNPAPVLASIPTAREFTHKGHKLVAMPHKIEEVRVLHNLGITAPSPILHYYNWPGNFTPYEHQMRTAAFLTTHRKSLVLNEIGTGKTQSALWAADYLMSVGAIKKCLIISPLSTLHRVWDDAVFKGFLHRDSVVLHGSRDKRLKLLEQEADFYIVNHDGFAIISEQAKDMFDLIIVDEAAVLRNARTNRYKVFSKWMKTQPNTWLWLMTGTPTPNAPTDAWTLAKLVDSPTVPTTMRAFRDLTMINMSQHVWVPKSNSANLVQYVLHPSIRYSRDECFDLPETVVQTREVPLSKEQQTAYTTMLKHYVLGVNGGEQITAVNEAVKMQKLIQIACGVAYADDGSDVEIDCKPRIKVVKEVIEEAGGKVIVFVPLTGTLNMLERELSKHWSVAVVNGAVSAKKRSEIYQNFQNATDPQVLIAHPATMAHGLTLTEASTIIWYGPITSNEQYTQACGRIERIGKTHTSNVVHIESTALERKMYARLHNRQKLQGVLLDLIEQEKHKDGH